MLRKGSGHCQPRSRVAPLVLGWDVPQLQAHMWVSPSEKASSHWRGGLLLFQVIHLPMHRFFQSRDVCALLCTTLCHPMDWLMSLSVCGISQVRIGWFVFLLRIFPNPGTQAHISVFLLAEVIAAGPPGSPKWDNAFQTGVTP